MSQHVPKSVTIECPTHGEFTIMVKDLSLGSIDEGYEGDGYGAYCELNFTCPGCNRYEEVRFE